jgi:exosortase
MAWSWWGALVLGLVVGFHVVAAYFNMSAADGLTFVLGVVGLAALCGGRRTLAWAWPACAFLLFMVPLPFRLEVALAQPLQRIATKCSTYLLQTFGVPALAEGNVILLQETQVGIVEACSGLSMMMLFFAMSVAVAIVVRRAWWEKAILLLSAAPIAIAANVIRIVVTCMLFEAGGAELARAVFHDLAGWLMMPLALLMLAVELFLLRRLVIEVEAPRPAPLVFAAQEASAPPRSRGGKRSRRQRRRA